MHKNIFIRDKKNVAKAILLGTQFFNEIPHEIILSKFSRK